MKCHARLGAVLLTASLVALSACSGGTDGTAGTAGAGADRVTVAVNTFSNETLDPSMDGSSALIYNGAMFDPFVGSAPDGTLSFERGVLESFEADATGTRYTMRLKPGITWHDGSAMTADDIAFSIDYLRRAEATCTLCGLLRGSVATVAVSDPATVELVLNAANFNLAQQFAPTEAALQVFPKAYIEKVGPEGFAQKPMGSGPWRYVGREVGQYVDYEANRDYWDPERVPAFATLRIVLAPEAATRLALLRQGEADLAIVEPKDAPNLESDGFRVVGPTNIGLVHVVFWGSYNPDFLTNKREFREALALAVDWDTIVETYYPGAAGDRHSGGAAPFSPLSLGEDESLRPYPYDPNQARALLQQAGYAGEPVTFWTYDTVGPLTGQNQVNESIAGYWREASVNVQMNPIDYGTFRSRFSAKPQEFSGPAEVGVMPIGTRPSVLSNIRGQMLAQGDGGTLSVYWDPASINAEFAAIQAIRDESERATRLAALNRSLYDEYWSIPYLVQNWTWAAGERVGGWTPTNGTDSGLAFETLTPAG